MNDTYMTNNKNDVYITDSKIKNGMIIFDYSKEDHIRDFKCVHAEAITLKNCPSKVLRLFECSNNLLTSLEYAPKIINGYFDCSTNYLTSLEHCPDIVGGYFYCGSNQITSLKGIGKAYCFEIAGGLDIRNNMIVSNILGLLYIKGLTHVLLDDCEVQNIINRHLKDRDLVKCKQELIENGLKEFAKL